MIVPSLNDETIGNPQAYEGPVKALLRLTETPGFLHSTDGCFYAQVSLGGRPEIHALKSAAFRAWLIDQSKNAFIARQGTAPHCPPPPLAWHIHCLREKPRKTSDHPHQDASAGKNAVTPK